MRATLTRPALIATVVTAGIVFTLASTAAAKPSYVALGDSYASGNGTGVYYSADRNCYQSRDAYPALLAAAKGYSLSFDACSGATTADVVDRQLGDLNRSTALVTVEVGGDDAGFITVLEACALHGQECEAGIRTADSYIEHSLPAVLNAAYADIRRAAPKAKVIVVGYPRLFTANGATCGLRLLTSADERGLNQTAGLLDSVIASRAAGHGFRFLDPRAAFASHEICSRSPWVNNVLIEAIQESFHPNIAGEAAYARLLEGSLKSRR